MLRAKKSLGQNFLTSRKIAKDIVRAAGVVAGDTVLEIGPGHGILTQELLNASAHVTAIEKDAELVTVLQEKFASKIKSGQLKLINADTLTDCNPITISYKLVANIPYYITGAIIKKFLTDQLQPVSITLLVQKEVAQRIIGIDGNDGNRITISCKESILSLSVKAYGEPKIIAKVPARFFKPRPKIDSAILHIASISKGGFSEITEEQFFRVIKTGFAQKRKKLVNNLTTLAPKNKILQVFKDLKIPENTRAEDVPLGKWRTITRDLYS